MTANLPALCQPADPAAPIAGPLGALGADGGFVSCSVAHEHDLINAGRRYLRSPVSPRTTVTLTWRPEACGGSDVEQMLREALYARELIWLTFAPPGFRFSFRGCFCVQSMRFEFGPFDGLLVEAEFVTYHPVVVTEQIA